MIDYNKYHVIADRGLANAQTYYEQKKRIFNNQMQQVITSFDTDIVEMLNDTLVKEISLEPIDQAFNEIYQGINEIYYDLLNTEIVEGTTLEDVIAKKRGNSSIGLESNKDINNYYARIVREIKKITFGEGVNDGQFRQWVISRIPQGFNKMDSATVNQFRSYAKRVLLLKYLGMGGQEEVNTNISYYKNTLKGYVRENGIDEAILDLAKKIKEFAGSGNLGSVTIEGTNKMIKTDAVIYVEGQGMGLKEITDTLSKIGSATGTGTVNLPSYVAGIQSKSWVAPFENVQGVHSRWLSIGTHALPSMEVTHWHTGMAYASLKAKEMLGVNNIIYSTGANVYWTSDLIREFKKLNYYIVYHFVKNKDGEGYKPTTSVRWEQEWANSKH